MRINNPKALQLLMDDKENTPKEKSEFRSLGFILMIVALTLTVLMGILILIG